MKAIMSGNEAIARGAYEYGVKFASAYPGTPSTEILEYVSRYEEIDSQWSPNEKVAVEVALGASIGGVRAIVAMKHVGVNVAADPLMTAAYTGITGGFVLISADDPGMHSSQNEQDNRNYAKFAKIPLLEPSDSDEAKRFLGIALDISEQLDLPVMLRMTTRVCHSSSVVSLGEKQDIPRKPYKKDFVKYVMLPSSARVRRIALEERIEKAKKFSERFQENRIEKGDKKIGFISSGVTYQYARELFPEASFLKLAMAFPLPEKKIRRFASMVERLIVIEELDPFLEEQIRAMGIEVHGKDIFSNIGEFDVDVLDRSFYKKRKKSADLNIPARPPVLCPGCSHRSVFYAFQKLRLMPMGDIGCYTLAALPPLGSMDSCICMGASIGVALGMTRVLPEKQKQKVVAVIGDSTFVHSGITGIVEAVYNHSIATICILDNCTTAMTGHQEHPGTGKTLEGEDTITLHLEKLCQVIGAEHVRIVNPMVLDDVIQALREETEFQGISVLIFRQPCIIRERHLIKPPLRVIPEKCTGCWLCLRLGCPAIEKDGEKVVINEILCTGCDLCAQLCNLDAITE